MRQEDAEDNRRVSTEVKWGILVFGRAVRYPVSH